MPTVKYHRTMIGKMTGHHSEAKINTGQSGLIEVCYDKNKAQGIIKIAEDHHYSEQVTFVCAINHLLLRKAGMASNLMKVACLSDGGIEAQMQQVHDLYIKENGERVVNIDHSIRKNITGHWTTIKSRQATGQLLTARQDVAQKVASALFQDIDKKFVSKDVLNTFNNDKSPTDVKVMKVLDSQSTGQIVHIDHENGTGKKLSHEETMKEYAKLLKAAH